jgi:pimeloyl-ACP methyl ester carboxylesterase
MKTMTSADGTAIGVLSHGTGPGIVLIPGSTRRAHHYDAFAKALGDRFTVHAIDRRGRGVSGPQGPGYTIDDEVEDALAVLDGTGSEIVFGHSYGGAIGLRLAQRRPLATLIGYEPAVSLNGRFDLSFLPAMTELIERRRYATAMGRLMTGQGIRPLGGAPQFAYTALVWLIMRTSVGADLRDTLPTVPAEGRQIRDLDSDGSQYATISTPTLLLGGDRSPEYMGYVLRELERIIPNATLLMSSNLDHNAPDQGAPETVAGLVRAFLTPADASF